VLLCLLASWALPDITGTVSLRDGGDTYSVWQTDAWSSDPAVTLALIGWAPHDLVRRAEDLLSEAHSDDPNLAWLPLIRHMSPSSWVQLRDKARDAIERRVAAEVLLCAYERLVERAGAAPLPDLAGAAWWHPLHDRLRGPQLAAVPLDAALSRLGLSPHPRVILLVEGDSEAIAARLLLAAMAIAEDVVRVHTLGGAGKDAKVLARFVAGPATTEWQGDGWALARPPAGLVVHVDPEQGWGPPEKNEHKRAAIVTELVEEVARRGARTTRADLDHLVRVAVAPQRGFEYSNFSDEELVDGLAKAARRCVDRSTLAASIARARLRQDRFDSSCGPIHCSKPDLAHVLAPLLLARLPQDNDDTPIIRAVRSALDLAARMPRGSVVLPAPDTTV
jgi:hypothetical protein